MPRSTAKFIAYDLRPAKQTERGLLIDALRLCGDVGLSLRDYRYVGMGAIRFYDFLLLHKYLGIRRMVSLEHDAKMFLRAQFNCPFKFVQVLKESSKQFLTRDTRRSNELFWFDYDGGISLDVCADIQSIGTRAELGDLAFVTVCGDPPGAIDQMSSRDRLVHLTEWVGDLAGNVKQADVENDSFPAAVYKILITAFRNAFAPRVEGRFVPILQVHYSDSISMVTVGGAFLSEEAATTLETRMAAALPFLGPNEMYDIRDLNLTEKERVVFDLAVTNNRRTSAEKNKLGKLGFVEGQLKAYGELIRYTPRYVESIV